jgi:hypothetical protein
MDKRGMGYWATTGLFALAMTGSGAGDVVQAAPMVEAVHDQMGYPTYFLIILGVWKLLGVGALLAPGLALVKEWAYAGFVFALTGAAASHVAIGDIPGAAPALVLTGITAASWWLRPADRRLG